MEVQERQIQLMGLLLVLIVELNQLVTKLDGKTNKCVQTRLVFLLAGPVSASLHHC